MVCERLMLRGQKLDGRAAGLGLVHLGRRWVHWRRVHISRAACAASNSRGTTTAIAICDLPAMARHCDTLAVGCLLSVEHASAKCSTMTTTTTTTLPLPRPGTLAPRVVTMLTNSAMVHCPFQCRHPPPSSRSPRHSNLRRQASCERRFVMGETLTRSIMTPLNQLGTLLRETAATHPGNRLPGPRRRRACLGSVPSGSSYRSPAPRAKAARKERSPASVVGNRFLGLAPPSQREEKLPRLGR